MDAMSVLIYLPLLWAVSTQSPANPLVNPPVAVKTMTACLAVTKPEVEDALGRSVGNGKERKSNGTWSCEYEAADGQVTITIYHSQAKLNLPAEIKNLRKAIPQAKIREVAGLGTRAFFMDMAAIGTQLHVICGEYDYLLVSVLGFGDANQVSSAAEKMARQALDRF